MIDKDVVRMANDIANFFKSYPIEESIELYSEHINKFWHKDLRRKLFEAAREDPSVYHTLVLISLDRIKCSEYNPINVKFKDKGGTGG